MKRVRSFLVANPSDASPSSHTPSNGGLVSFESWHDFRKQVKSQVAAAELEEAIVIDAISKQTIASISQINEQHCQLEKQSEADERVTLFPKWDSQRIATIGEHEFFLNRNVTDFEWHLLEGAKYDVPFRLSYLERLAERHPEGLIASLQGSARAWRDMLAPGRVS